jgi:amino acid permease
LYVTTALADAPCPASRTVYAWQPHSHHSLLQFSAWEVFLKGNWSTATFVTNYFPIIFFPVIYVAAKFVMGVRTVSADDMDFVSNVAEFDAMTCVQHYCGEKRRVRA